MIDPSSFLPGLQLSELFFHEAVRPILESRFPGLPYSAGLIGDGSEVLGYDTPQSTDHHWGPRMQLFLTEGYRQVYGEKIANALSAELPRTFHGFPTSFGEPDEDGVRQLEVTDSGPVHHRVDILTLESFFQDHMALEIDKELSSIDWLVLPEQKLLTVTAGKVFFDGLRRLEQAREKLRYYPHDVWLYLLGCQWTKIAQEEAFVGRCAAVGDGPGSKLEAARIVRFIMKLCFLMEKKYAPYPKWFGTAFSKLTIARELGPVLDAVLSAKEYPEREAALAQAYESVARAHNSLGITPPLHTQVSFYFDRPYRVIHAGSFAREIKKQIQDPEVLAIAKWEIGSIDQFVDSTDVLGSPRYSERLKAMYRGN